MSRGPTWVTGAQGFIGRHLAERLAQMEHRVVGFGRAPVLRDRAEEADYPLSPEGLAAALTDHGCPSRVYHLAGGPTVGQSITEPHSDFLANVATTETLLETLRSFEQRVPIVLASSAAVYGAGHIGPIGVSDTLAPSSPYGYHKLMAEHLVRAHAETFDLPVSICRLFSIYGPGLHKQLLFDVCSRLSAAPKGAVLQLGGTGEEQRDWLHVSDAVEGLARLPSPSPGQVACYNLASAEPTSIRDITERLVEAWGEGGSVVFSGEPRPGDPFSLVSDRASLPPGFSPSIALSDGLAAFTLWFRRKEIQAS